MKFVVEFRGFGGFAISIGARCFGLSFVDMVRAKENEVIPASKFSSSAFGFSRNVEIEIDEELARRSGLFAECNKVVVRVKPEELNKFVVVDYKVKRDENGEVVKVEPVLKVDEKSIIDWWRFNGLPASTLDNN